MSSRVKEIEVKGAALLESLEKTPTIESSEQLAVLLEEVKVLVELLPCGERDGANLMANHSSELEEFAKEIYGNLLTEIMMKFDEIPVELFAITDNADFVVETMNVLSDTTVIEKNPKLVVKLLEALLTDENYLIFAFSRLSRGALTDKYQQQLISLPDKIANKMRSDFPRTFSRYTFSAIVMVNALKTLHVLCEVNAAEQSKVYDTKFLSKLISKIYVNFKDDKAVLTRSLRVISAMVERPVYRESIREILSGLQRPAIEIVAQMIFGSEDKKQRLLSMCGDFWKTISNWKFTLTKKIPLLSFTSDDKIVENLSFFLATEDANLLEQLLMEMLLVWSTKSHVRDTSFEQHFYVTKFIVLLTKHLENPKSHESKLKRLLFNGMEIHVGSSDDRLQTLGMIAAETILGIIDSDLKEEEKLKFDYSSKSAAVLKEIVKVIRNYPDKADSSDSLQFAEDYDDSEVTEAMRELITVADRHEVKVLPRLEVTQLVPEIKFEPALAAKKPTVELDSDDDDLQPYDDPDDLPTRLDHKQPRYLLDLIQAFTSRESLENPEVFEFAMKSAEQIIKQQLPNHHTDIAVDLLCIFIKLYKRCCFENFEELKTKLMVEICVIHPKESAECLCKEFNAEATKYTMHERLLMLDVLGEAAKKLSKLEIAKYDDNLSKALPTQPQNKLLIKLHQELENRNRRDAQKIISNRLKAKTRRIVTRTKAPDENAAVNRFADVAGTFFFPLMHGFGRKQMAFKTGSRLQHEFDNLLLMKFLNTISVMLLCAENSVIAPKMAKEIMSLSAFLRYHEESKIRLAVLHMIATVFLAIPQNILVSDFKSEISELVNHLLLISKSGVVNHEPDQECRAFAKQLLGMFNDSN